MARRKAAVAREIQEDELYRSVIISRFINLVMRCGKKSIAEKIVYKSLDVFYDRIAKGKAQSADSDADAKTTKKTLAGRKSVAPLSAGQKKEILEALDVALKNVSPTVEVKSKRVGGATYQVPIEVKLGRAIALAIRWIIAAAKARSEKSMAERLGAELYDAIMNRGSAVKKRDDVHRMAYANKAFAGFLRW